MILALCAAAVVVARHFWRGSRWAWWALLLLSATVAVGGAVTGYYVVPLVVTALALATLVLLLQRDSRAWTRPSGP